MTEQATVARRRFSTYCWELREIFGRNDERSFYRLICRSFLCISRIPGPPSGGLHDPHVTASPVPSCSRVPMHLPSPLTALQYLWTFSLTPQPERLPQTGCGQPREEASTSQTQSHAKATAGLSPAQSWAMARVSPDLLVHAGLEFSITCHQNILIYSHQM